MKKLLFSAIVTALLLLTAVPLMAWGPEGHEIVAELAWIYLTPAARERVTAILGDMKLSDYDVASWADTIKGSKEYEALYPKNRQWHYLDLDVLKSRDQKFELTEDGNDIVQQIIRWKTDLASDTLEGDRALDGLRFLVHFVGDLHQPLHCAFRYGDMGGNMLPVNSFTGRHYSFEPGTPMDYPPSLHSTWDEYLVYELVAGRKTKTVVRELHKSITYEDITYWKTDDVMAWAIDGYWIARKQAYRWTSGDAVPFKWSRPGMDLTGENYIDEKIPYVAKQLQKGGVRLAHLLNSIYDPGYPGTTDNE